MISINNLVTNSIVITTAPVDDGKTRVKYTAASGLSDWEGDIVGELTDGLIPNKSNMAEVEIGSHVTNIGFGAFSVCRGLTSITIPNNMTSIGERAFGYCSSLTSVTIPNSVTNIGFGAFTGCSSIMNMTFSGKDKFTVQGMDNYSWYLPSGCVLHCTDGDITL